MCAAELSWAPHSPMHPGATLALLGRARQQRSGSRQCCGFKLAVRARRQQLSAQMSVHCAAGPSAPVTWWWWAVVVSRACCALATWQVSSHSPCCAADA